MLPDSAAAGVDGSAALYWEDLAVGATWRFGSYEVTEGEIVEFATRYDPMPMHLSRELAKETPLGQFCASGIHTFAMTQKMVGDNLFLRTRLIAGGELRRFVMRRPVVPGDRLSVRITVASTSEHRHRPAAGWAEFDVETLRADGQTVLEHRSRILFERRRQRMIDLV